MEDIIADRNKMIKDYEVVKHIPKERVCHLPNRTPSKVEVTDLDTGNTIIRESLYEIANELGIKKNSLEKAILVNDGVYKGKLYRYINKLNNYSNGPS